MKRGKNLIFWGTFIFAIFLSFITVKDSCAGPRWDVGEDSWLQLGILGQVHFSHMEDAAVENDFYLRRGRIIIQGQVMDGIKFFVETDNANAGKYGVSEAETKIQDAFMDFRLDDSRQWIKAGLILLPFSFETRSSAASLLGIDYNSETIKLVNTFVWRDYGAELSGGVGDKFNYRIGVFDGYDSDTGIKYNDASLRFTGHIAYNLIGKVEDGWFFSQTRLSAKNDYLSIGAGIDHQSKATINAESVVQDNRAWVLDMQSGFIFGDNLLTVNGAYYDWDNALYKGKTAFIETGYLIGKIMPTFKISYLDPDNAGSTTDTTFGVDYFWKGQNARIGVEYRTGDSKDWLLAGLQFLL